MGRSLKNHLTPEEVEALLAKDDEKSGRGSGEQAAHARACAQCGAALERQQALQRILSRAGAGGVTGPAPAGACPAPEVWFQIAAGWMGGAEAREWLGHAAGCPHCGPLLRAAVADLADETTAEAGPAPSHRAGAWLGRWAPVWAAAAILAAGAGVWAYRAYLARHAPAALLARAYAANRTLALRLPGAGYAPVAAQRGGEAPRSPALLEAEDRIAHALERQPASAVWLDLQARADLLEWNYAQALAHAQRGLLAQPRSVALLTDFASAYFERAEAAGNGADYDAALEALGRALAADPNDLTARFNRALVAERLLLYSQAIRDWQRYLGQDASSGWAAAARQHMAADEKAVASHDRTYARPLLGPAAYVEAAARGDPVLQGRDEDYLVVALTQWLSAAFPPPSAHRSPSSLETRQALTTLARRLRQRHRDSWLIDLLSSAGAAPRAVFARAVAELARSETANRGGDPVAAAAEAERARRDFLAAGSDAGSWRAELESVYSLDRRELSRRCLARVGPLIAASRRRGYRWIEADARLERSNCRGVLGGFAAAHAEKERALALARQARYPSLAMRATAFLAAPPAAPDDATIWNRHHMALASYWASSLRPMWGYQLYMTLALRSADLERPHAALAFARAAVGRIRLSPDRSFEAIARRQAALYALQSGDAAAAQAELERAKGLFARLPSNAATRNFEAINDLELAQAAADARQTTLAATLLERFRREQPPMANLSYRALPYYELLGRVALAQHREEAARKAFEAALWIDNADLASFASDRERLAWERRNFAPYRGLVRIALATQRDPLPALELWESARGAVLRSQLPAAPPPLGALAGLDAFGLLPPPPSHLVRRALPALRAAQIVSYAVLPDALAIWRFDNRGVELRRVPVAAERLRQSARAFAAACADPRADPALLRAQGEQLYRWLIAPIAASLEPRRELVIESDEGLGRVPFAALVTPSGRWLGERYTLRSSPGLAYAPLARPARPIRADAAVLAVGDPALGSALGDGGFPPLPAAAEEAREVAARFSRRRLLVGRQATLPAVLAALPQAEVFHFAGHAQAQAEATGLLLSGASRPALLTADLLSRDRLRRCRLAVLAACATAPGSAVFADATSLVRALLRAGVPTVVASRWPVDSASTAALSEAFYAALLEGNSSALSLQRAEEAVRHQPGRGAPYYWASFALFGAQP